MNSLNKLEALIDEIKQEEVEDLNFQQSLDCLKSHNEKFKILFAQWIEDCKKGVDIPFERVKYIIEAAEKELGDNLSFRFSLKRPSPYGTVCGFNRKLDYLKFELDKRNFTKNNTECDCSLRLLNRIVPDFDTLVDYGRAVLYYEDDNYIIKECRFCETKWIDATVPGMLSTSNTWREWNPEEYLQREVFAKK